MAAGHRHLPLIEDAGNGSRAGNAFLAQGFDRVLKVDSKLIIQHRLRAGGGGTVGAFQDWLGGVAAIREFGSVRVLLFADASAIVASTTTPTRNGRNDTTAAKGARQLRHRGKKPAC